jgi:hypothetical protein
MNLPALFVDIRFDVCVCLITGNSKTRLVMAAASSFSLPVISLSVADVYSAYVGTAIHDKIYIVFFKQR